MTVTNLKAIAIQKHRDAMACAKSLRNAYGMSPLYRPAMMTHLERAAAARFVYANAEAINATR
jgi:hypothetical protein